MIEYQTAQEINFLRGLGTYREKKPKEDFIKHRKLLLKRYLATLDRRSIFVTAEISLDKEELKRIVKLMIEELDK